MQTVLDNDMRVHNSKRNDAMTRIVFIHHTSASYSDVHTTQILMGCSPSLPSSSSLSFPLMQSNNTCFQTTSGAFSPRNYLS